MTRAMWTREEIEVLTKVYAIKTSSQMKEIFPNYTREQVYRKAKQLNLKKDPLVAKQSRVENSIIQRQDLWSDDEILILLEVYPKFGAEGVRKEIKSKLNKDRKTEAIISQANNRHLKREQKNVLNWTVEDVSLSSESQYSITIKYKGW